MNISRIFCISCDRSFIGLKMKEMRRFGAADESMDRISFDKKVDAGCWTMRKGPVRKMKIAALEVGRKRPGDRMAGGSLKKLPPGTKIVNHADRWMKRNGRCQRRNTGRNE
jgi:hypothetical protein